MVGFCPMSDCYICLWTISGINLLQPSISRYEPLQFDICLHYIVNVSAVQLGSGRIGHALENAIENVHAYLDPVISNSAHLASTAHNLHAQGVSDHCCYSECMMLQSVREPVVNQQICPNQPKESGFNTLPVVDLGFSEGGF